VRAANFEEFFARCKAVLKRYHSQGILTEGERLSTGDLLIKVACFVKIVNNFLNIKGADLN
jgi:hypothetical protein